MAVMVFSDSKTKQNIRSFLSGLPKFNTFVMSGDVGGTLVRFQYEYSRKRRVTVGRVFVPSSGNDFDARCDCIHGLYMELRND